MHRSRRIAPGMPLHGPDRKSAWPAKSRTWRSDGARRRRPHRCGRQGCALPHGMPKTAPISPRGEKLRLNSVLLRHRKAGIGSKSPQLQETPYAAHPPPPPPPPRIMPQPTVKVESVQRPPKPIFPRARNRPHRRSPRRALKAGHPPRHALPASRRGGICSSGGRGTGPMRPISLSGPAGAGSARPGAGARGRCARLACQARRARDLLVRGPDQGIALEIRSCMSRASWRSV